MKISLKTAFGALFLGTVCAFTSCSMGDDPTYLYYDDVSVASASFGTLTASYSKKKADGTDSSYTFNASKYRICIDQLNRRIFNLDSLPLNTRLDIVKLSLGTTNGAAPFLMKTSTADGKTDTTYTYISGSEELDFKVPDDASFDNDDSLRVISVFSNDGLHRCDYKVMFVAHKEAPDSFTWSRHSVSEELAQLTDVRALTAAGKVFVMGEGRMYSCPTDGNEWQFVTSFDRNASVVTDGTTLYALSLDALSVSNDGGETWTTTATDAPSTPISTLVAAYDGTLYAVSAEGKLVESADNGASWSESPVDEPAAPLPLSNVSSFTEKIKTNDGVTRLFIAGNNPMENADEDARKLYFPGYAVVWSRLFDSDRSTPEDWTYHTWFKENKYKLPALRGLSAVNYGDCLLAIGSTGAADGKEEYKQVYVSIDHGLTWKSDKSYPLPEGFSVPEGCTAAMTADDSNIIWIVCGGTGEVMRGRKNSMTWNDPQKVFE